MAVPFFDLTRQFARLRAALLPELEDLLQSGDYAQGSAVVRFEEEFARTHDVPHCVAVGSGTDALHAILWALGVKPGDEVVTVAHTFVATPEAVALTGAAPVFADVLPGTLTMDPRSLERAITPRTRAVIPVHLYGHPAAMGAILEIASARGIPVVEDACQAHGAQFQGTSVGGFGVAAAFSFYPSKNIGAFGEAGAVLTRDGDLAATIRGLRNHGQTVRHRHDRPGHNYRMDNLQGAVLAHKLRSLEEWTGRRRAIAALYAGLLEGTDGLLLPREAPGARHVYHLYVVRTPQRDRLRSFLEERGIGTGLHYPVPCHRQPAFASAAVAGGGLPVTEAASEQVLSLPMFPELTDEEVGTVAGAIREFFERTP